jgi:transposase-like protein
MGTRGYPTEFRRRVLDLVDAGRKVVDPARDLGVSGQTIYAWRRQARIDSGLAPGLSSGERDELVPAKLRIRELEAELEVHPSCLRAARGAHRPKRRFAAITVIAAEGLSVELACRALHESASWSAVSAEQEVADRTLQAQCHPQFATGPQQSPMSRTETPRWERGDTRPRARGRLGSTQ